MIPNRTPVESSLVAAIGHDENDFYAEFTNGQEYRYDGAAGQFNQALAAESVGKFINKNIKGVYPYQQV